MGNIDSKSTNNSNFLLQYQQIRTEYDARFGEASIVKETSSQNALYLAKEKWIDSETESNKFKNTLSVYKTIDNRNVCRLLDYDCTLSLSNFIITKINQSSREF